MIERQLWHPVALADDVASTPVAVRLLGENLVLWRDDAKVVHAWPDRCPHRGAQLSLGRVVADAWALGWVGVSERRHDAAGRDGPGLRSVARRERGRDGGGAVPD